MLFLPLFPLAAAIPASKFALHESRPSAPEGFVSRGIAPPSEDITLRFALTPKDIVGLEDKLLSISTPGSPDFRKWLSAAEVKSFTQPSSETTAAFSAFAASNNLAFTSSESGEWASITLPVAQANALFAADFQFFALESSSAEELETSTETITRTLSISLPAELVGHVDVIHPSTQFIAQPRLQPPPEIFRRKLRKRVDASCDTTTTEGVITPKCLQDLYGIPAAPATHSAGKNRIVVTGFEEQWMQETDLTASTAFVLVRPDIPASAGFTLLTTANGTNPQGPGLARGESTLDVEYTVGVATGIESIFLSVGGEFNETALLDAITFLEAMDDEELPTVMSNSYGTGEEFFGKTLATAASTAASSDAHPAPAPSPASSPPAAPGSPPSGAPPASLPTSTHSTSPAAPSPPSFPPPSYQSPHVAAFLATVPTSLDGLFPRTGRAHPDVSAQAWAYRIVQDGQPDTIGGTSAATPAVASIIALINDALLARGKPVLGFLNPWMYTNADAFDDVTVGHNAGFWCDPGVTPAFDAVEGWDALTGLGTPQYERMLAAALA
ncbi:Family S53 protease-like protein [Mycena kentingensis (nom. inval.)]|nr:Family S53 protease-like protein [Mycena kentingensis (nom. inval.)]